MGSGARPFYTVGHSNLPLGEFLDILVAAEIDLVVDVRKLPGSRRNPQFNDDALADSLPATGISYRKLESLAGRRTVSRETPFEVNAFWQNRSFHNYADHALTDGFRDGLDTLREWGTAQTVAVMCSEAVWWRCHRRLIADHLLARGEQVLHLMGPEKVTQAEMTAGAVVGPEKGDVTYPAR
ncbi:DUF488 domain-containing protein [Citricoccus alkalitolerans]|uniref:DUF488 domain-containing protein n=1 Tax=Citricoccus alkalitolerans TaxID=246603 RepID=A0ABV8XY17_9MICC